MLCPWEGSLQSLCLGWVRLFVQDLMAICRGSHCCSCSMGCKRSFCKQGRRRVGLHPWGRGAKLLCWAAGKCWGGGGGTTHDSSNSSSFGSPSCSWRCLASGFVLLAKHLRVWTNALFVFQIAEWVWPILSSGRCFSVVDYTASSRQLPRSGQAARSQVKSFPASAEQAEGGGKVRYSSWRDRSLLEAFLTWSCLWSAAAGSVIPGKLHPAIPTSSHGAPLNTRAVPLCCEKERCSWKTHIV